LLLHFFLHSKERHLRYHCACPYACHSTIIPKPTAHFFLRGKKERILWKPHPFICLYVT
jgi:hypothetical protein